RDDPPFLLVRLPAETVGEAFEQRFDPPRTRVGNRARGLRVDRDLLVLRAQAPRGARLCAAGNVLDELVELLDRSSVRPGFVFDVVAHGVRGPRLEGRIG